MTVNFEKLRAVFDAAVEGHTPEQWDAYLDQACAGDEELRRQTALLLKAHAEGQGPLDRNAFGDRNGRYPAMTEHSGTVIGPYKLLEQIGEGGFGIVFMAEQQHPVRRKVALKVIKPDMDSKQIIARFEAERQALAMMDHQNIARVLDAGATDSGRHYFIMELVRGIPITQFCDDNRLTLRERLELFLAVCQAVQHAHQKGIIHRDLKPSNVLVTLHDGTAVVKVIDFGIAKALGQQRLTDKTLVTGFAQMLGTPLYMSPEQAEMSGLDADTRTDIYSLGVLLYELLTGTTPFDKDRLKEASYDEIRRIIREEEPAKPSTRISTLGQAAITVSDNRQSEPKRLRQLFRGELDWIVMKALEKDRNRRYDTASSFAADVQRYLHDEPVEACPPSVLYRFRKFARRNKAALVTAAAITITVLMAGAVSSGLIWRANRELRQTLYFQSIALADREWSANNLGRMEQLLDDCPEDLRGWEWHYLKRLRVASLLVLPHPSSVEDVAFSPDGRRIAAGGQDGTIKIWNATTGREMHSFQAHENNVSGLVFSPDSRKMSTASLDGSVKVFDAETGQERFTLCRTLNAEAKRVAFSPDGRWVAAGIGFVNPAVPGEVKVWDAITGQECLSLGEHSGEVTAVAFSPDGQRLASASFFGIVTLWNVQTGRQILTFRAHRCRIDHVAFSPDGKQLASAPSDYRTKADADVKIWDAQTGQEALTLRGHVGLVVSVAFTPDGRRLASAGGDGTVKLWDLATGQEALSLRGHHGYVRGVAFSPDGHRLVSAGTDGTVRIWDATPLAGEAGQEVRTLRGHEGGVRSVAFQPGGRYLASAGNDETVRLWDLRLGRMGGGNPLIHTLPGDTGFVMTVSFSSDGKFLASTGMGHTVRVRDATTWKELYGDVEAGRHVAAFSPDGRYLVAVGPEYSLVILDARSGHSIRTLQGHKKYIRAVAFSPDSRSLASGSADGTVRIWDVDAGKGIVDPPLRHRGFVSAAVFSPDGRLLASAGDDRIVKVWDTTTWKEVQTLRDPTGGVFSLAFHKDGRRIAWGGTDSTIKIGDVKTGEILHTLRGHTSWVESVAFSPDGEWIASASLDGAVKLWLVPSVPRPARSE
jgi:WD40 repeat protein/serine/threonine protein kinase